VSKNVSFRQLNEYNLLQKEKDSLQFLMSLGQMLGLWKIFERTWKWQFLSQSDHERSSKLLDLFNLAVCYFTVLLVVERLSWLKLLLMNAVCLLVLSSLSDTFASCSCFCSLNLTTIFCYLSNWYRSKFHLDQRT
jgi:membrane-associated HD superfamily phosphohydrolase